MGRAAERWRAGLQALAVPQAILDAAPTSPWGFPVEVFAERADRAVTENADSPSRRLAREALPEGGSVLDVGCGAGAGSLPLIPPAGLVLGVDESEEMLPGFAERVAARGAVHAEVAGRWPDIASRVPAADVVVCHHVLFNVPDLAPFAEALSHHAHRRVVVESTVEHPLEWLRPYWRRLHGWDRPPAPRVEDAVAVLEELGYTVGRETWERESIASRKGGDLLDFVRQRLCLPPDRDAELAAALEATPPPATGLVATLWWEPPEAR